MADTGFAPLDAVKGGLDNVGDRINYAKKVNADRHDATADYDIIIRIQTILNNGNISEERKEKLLSQLDACVGNFSEYVDNYIL